MDTIGTPEPSRSRITRPGHVVLIAVTAALVAAGAVTTAARLSSGGHRPASATTVAHSCGRDIEAPPGSHGAPDNPFVVQLGVNEIPAITHPRFESAAAAERWLPADAPVITFTERGFARAYPLAILEWHEVVDDVVAGDPIAVTYCPLCNSAIVYDRRVGTAHPRLLQTSGALDNGALVLIDAHSRRLWLQPSGKSLYPGRPLPWRPSGLMSLRAAAASYRHLQVLSRRTGYVRDYSASPYGGVGGPGKPTGFRGFYDERIPPKTRVSGVVLAGRARAWQYPSLARREVVNDTVGAHPVVVLYDPKVSGIGNSADLRHAAQVGSSSTFLRTVAGRVLTFRPAGDGRFRDLQTASIWTFAGRAVAGSLRGTQLIAVRHLDTYWFAWAAFYPGTSVDPPAPPCQR